MEEHRWVEGWLGLDLGEADNYSLQELEVLLEQSVAAGEELDVEWILARLAQERWW